MALRTQPAALLNHSASSDDDEQPQPQNPQSKPQEESQHPEDEPAVMKKSSSSHVRKRPSDHIHHEVVSKIKKRKISTREKQIEAQVNNGTSKNEEGCSVIEEKKSTMNNGLLSEKDEIVLLDSFFDYKYKTRSHPTTNMDAFHEYVKAMLSVDVTKTHLCKEMRRLRNKFLKNAEKWKKNGQAPVFSTPHEQMLYELSHNIWRDYFFTHGNYSKAKSTKKKDNKDGNIVSSANMPLKPVGNRDTVLEVEVKDTNMEEEEETQDFWSLYPRLCAFIESGSSSYLTMVPGDSKELSKEIICALGKHKAKELEEGWKAFHVMDYQLYVKRVQLIVEQTEAVSDVIKHSNIQNLCGQEEKRDISKKETSPKNIWWCDDNQDPQQNKKRGRPLKEKNVSVQFQAPKKAPPSGVGIFTGADGETYYSTTKNTTRASTSQPVKSTIGGSASQPVTNTTGV